MKKVIRPRRVRFSKYDFGSVIGSVLKKRVFRYDSWFL